MWLQVESALRPLLDAYFSPLSDVQVLAQPGNFYVASAFCLAVTIMGKKMVNHGWDNLAQGNLIWLLCYVNSNCILPKDFLYFQHSDPMFILFFLTGENNESSKFLYYMNEGIYGPFSCKLLGNTISAPSVHKVSRPLRLNPIHMLRKRPITLHFTMGKRYVFTEV